MAVCEANPTVRLPLEALLKRPLVTKTKKAPYFQGFTTKTAEVGLSTSSVFQELIAKARAEIEMGKSLSLEEMRREVLS